jgi:hypothetical protein
MPRYYLAILTAACFAGTAVFMIWPPAWLSQELVPVIVSFLWRMGALLAVLWLAYPDLMRIPRWVALAVPVLLIVIVKWPKMIFVIVPAMIVLVALQRLLRPKPPSAPRK